MEQKLLMSVQDGMDYQEFKSYMDGYSAGVAAAVEVAKTARTEQLKRRQPTEPKAAEPKADSLEDSNNGTDPAN